MADNRNRDEDGNGVLITGVVIVLALMAGLYIWGNNESPGNIEPAAGSARMESGTAQDSSNAAPAKDNNNAAPQQAPGAQ